MGRVFVVVHRISHQSRPEKQSSVHFSEHDEVSGYVICSSIFRGHQEFSMQEGWSLHTMESDSLLTHREDGHPQADRPFYRKCASCRPFYRPSHRWVPVSARGERVWCLGNLRCSFGVPKRFCEFGLGDQRSLSEPGHDLRWVRSLTGSRLSKSEVPLCRWVATGRGLDLAGPTNEAPLDCCFFKGSPLLGVLGQERLLRFALLPVLLGSVLKLQQVEKARLSQETSRMEPARLLRKTKLSRTCLDHVSSSFRLRSTGGRIFFWGPGPQGRWRPQGRWSYDGMTFSFWMKETCLVA